MKKLSVLIAAVALLAAAAVGYAATKSPANTPKDQGCCPSSCPSGGCSGCSSCGH
jgi:hypothetical protein